MEKDDPLLTAMFEMCNRKNPLNDGQREWSIADLPGLLREGCYDELEARYSRALAESLTSREAEKRYFLAWTQMCNHFYDMDALVEAGPAGLALIKNWQRARPRSSYAWLAGPVLEPPRVALSQLRLGAGYHPRHVDLRQRLQ